MSDDLGIKQENAAQRRLILHCGFQKTATTSLHHFIGRNEVRLAQHLEVLTPKRRSPTRALGRASAEYSADPTAEKRDTFIANIKTIRDLLLSGSGTCLISHENLPGAMMGWPGVTALYPRITEIMDLLDTHLSPLSPEYVFYTREMSAWKSSVYNQAVKTNSYSGPFAQFVCETRDCGSWEDLKARVTEHLGEERVCFFDLEDERDTGRPGSQLLRCAGLSELQINALDPIEGHRNQSLNTGSLEFMRHLNALGLAPNARNKVRNLVLEKQSLFIPT